MRGRAGGGGTPATPVAMATRPRPCISDTRKIVSKGHGFVGGGTPIPVGPALEGVPGSSAEASPRLDQGAGARGASTCTTATLWQPPRSGQHLGAQRPPRLLTRACPVQTARSARPRLLGCCRPRLGASGLRGCSLTAYFAAAHCHGVHLPPPPVSSQQRHVPGRGPGWRCARWTLSVSASGPVGSHGCQWAWPRGVTWN